MKKAQPAQKGLTIADMAKQKSQAGLYGANAGLPQQQQSQPQQQGNGSAMDDLLG